MPESIENKFMLRITVSDKYSTEQWAQIQKLFHENNVTILASCYETGKRKENPHYHLIISYKHKESSLRKRFCAKYYKKLHSLKPIDPDKLKDLQLYMSKQEHNGDKVLKAYWNVKEANKEYWENNDKLINNCKTISEKLLYYYQNKFKQIADYRVEKIINKCSYNPPDKEEIQIYYSNLEYFRTNGKLIPLDHDMKKYIRTIRCMLSQNDDYIDELALNYFRN